MEQCKENYSKWYCKKILFDPHSIVEINYWTGCHEATPQGNVKIGENEFLLLHQKRISVKYVINRYYQLAQRLSQNNIDKEMGLHYYMKEQEIKEAFESCFQRQKIK